MRKMLTVYLTEDDPDMLGNDGNVDVSLAFVGEEEAITLTFGGRDGSSDMYVTLDELRHVFAAVGTDL